MGFPIKVSVLGGVSDPMRYSANSLEKYLWDLSAETFIGDINRVGIQSKYVGQPSFSTFYAPLQNKTVQGVVDALNTLQMGFFWLNGTDIVTTNDTFVFGDISVTS